MILASGTRLGVYEVTSQIGEDYERLAQFQREAEVLASLNHPHIASIYGLEECERSQR